MNRWLFSILMSLITILVISCAGVPGSSYSNNEEANKLFAQGRYTEALDLYRNVQVERPDLPHLDYNAGTTLHKLGDYQRSLPQLQHALSASDTRVQSMTHYNMGNTLYMMEQLPQAIEEYKKTLRIDPKDMDAKHNLEYLQSLLAQRQQNQPPQDQIPQAGDDQSNTDQQGASPPNTNQGTPNANTPSQNQNNNQQRQDSRAEAQRLERQIREMLEEAGEELTIEEALRILDTLREREKDIRDSVNWDAVRPGGSVQDRDW